MEKLFYVARMYEYSTPTVVFSTTNKSDAFEYAAIMNRTDGKNYSVLAEETK